MFLRPNWQEMESGVCARKTFARAMAAMRRTGTIRNRRAGFRPRFSSRPSHAGNPLIPL
jgi:hypothetical protein